MAEVDRLSKLDLSKFELKQIESAIKVSDAPPVRNSSNAVEIAATEVDKSDKPELNVAQSALRTFVGVDQYIKAHPEQKEGVTAVMAFVQGPKGMVQLALYNVLGQTPLRENLIAELATYSDIVGHKLANGMEGIELDKQYQDEDELIGGGQFFSSILIGVMQKRKGKGEEGPKGTIPENMSPIGTGRSGAFNEAKRQSGIPTSQQLSRTVPDVDKRGNPQPG
ncbi:MULTISPECIES: hypothetical protein [Pseudomonas syringae group]|uniref:Uncharacterized protein n=1 Tax=Pseudomonas syringae CC1417 TaxID=1357272 RepID=A0AAU8LLR9_PSESX|nr:hypothetical protein [Pseudomonas asturiensis]